MTFKKLFFALLFFLWQCCFIFSGKIGVVYDILNPYSVRASHDSFLISDQYFISYYSMDKLKLVKKIGGKGAGPKEYLFQPRMKVFKDKLMVFSGSRIDFYSFKGELINQKTINFVAFDIDYAKDNFITSQWNFSQGNGKYDIMDFNLLNSDFKKIKTIISMKKETPNTLTRQNSYLVAPLNRFLCFDGNIYIVSENQVGFVLTVFDNQGSLLKTIQRDYEKIKISDEYKIKRIEEFKSIPAVKKRWESLSKLYNYTFPEYFPAIADFRIVDGKIYVKTYKSNNSKVEYVILDLNGKLLGKVFLPDIKEKFYDIQKNYFYYLQENENEEVWEVYSIKIL